MQHALRQLNMPVGTVGIINNMLADPRCTSDHILIIADALEAAIREVRALPQFQQAMHDNAMLLREWAPQYSNRPLGKAHGDFDGTLTP